MLQLPFEPQKEHEIERAYVPETAAPQSFAIALIGLRKLDLKSTPWRPILLALVSSTILTNPDFANGDGENVPAPCIAAISQALDE